MISPVARPTRPKAVPDADSFAGVAANPRIMIITTQSPPIRRGCRMAGRTTSWAMPTFGFALPRLRRRDGFVRAGPVVGLLWGLWHFSMFAGTRDSPRDAQRN